MPAGDFFEGLKIVEENRMGRYLIWIWRCYLHMSDWSTSSLTRLALDLLAKGPHKLEKTNRRVRGLYHGTYIFDTTEARHVWEHPYFPQFYVLSSAAKASTVTKKEPVDKEESAFLATLKVKNKSTDRVICFEKGPLAGLTRFEFAALGSLWNSLPERRITYWSN